MTPRTPRPGNGHLVPLVSVGVPTFNRATTLLRTIESILSQDWSGLEIVISDNASTDSTEAVCGRFCRADPRVRYFRHKTNLGPTANFIAALQQSRGEYFMWLGDDDWLPDPSYISQCTGLLMTAPDYSLVGGVVRYFIGDSMVMEGNRINLPHPSPAERVAGYYSAVADNGIFYGVMRRGDLLRAGVKRVVAGDWLIVAAIAFLGKVKTLESTSVYREDRTADRSFEKLVADNGQAPIRGRFPFFFIGLSIVREIAWASPVFRSLSLERRLALGIRCLAIVLHRHSWPGVREKVRRAAQRLLPRWAQTAVRSTLRRSRQKPYSGGRPNPTGSDAP